jgi:hypothetical protein
MTIKEKIKKLYNKYKESQNEWTDVFGRKQTGEYWERDPADPTMYAMIIPIALLGLGLAIYTMFDGKHPCGCNNKQDSMLEQKAKSVIIDSVKNDMTKYHDSINYFQESLK